MKKRTAAAFFRLLSYFIVTLTVVLLLVHFSSVDVEAPSGDPNTAETAGSSQTETVDPITDLTDTLTSSTVTVTVTVTDTETESESTKSSVPTDTGTVTDTEVNITTSIPPQDGKAKKIAFTFDDGPHFKFTKQIADAFEKNGGNCTFFVVANRISGSNKDAMVYAAGKGNEIGSHSYTHKNYFNNCSEENYLYEINQADKAIKEAIGVSPVLLRPPGGSMTKTRIANAPYAIINWNVDPEDWKYKKESDANVQHIVDHILSKVTPGDIILMHDIYQNTAEAVEILLPKLKERGYEFVTVSELLGEHLAPGIRYYSAY